jgi:hypothetical protein
MGQQNEKDSGRNLHKERTGLEQLRAVECRLLIYDKTTCAFR